MTRLSLSRSHASPRRWAAYVLSLPFLASCAMEVIDAEGTRPVQDVAVVTASVEEYQPRRQRMFVLSAEAGASHEASGWSTYNSHGGVIFVERRATGRYTVHAQSITDAAGTVQVVAYGSDASRCKVASWGANSTRFAGNLAVHIVCHDETGANADSRFAMHFLGRAPRSENLFVAYVWTSNSGASHVASSAFSAVGGGSAPEVRRDGTGRYRVFFRNGVEASYDGWPQVTAYGTGPEYCNVTSHGFNGEDGVYVGVHCFDRNGALVDSRFTALWHQGFIDGDLSVVSAHTYANRETITSYTHDYQIIWADLGSSIIMNRGSTGSYSFEVRSEEVAPRLPLVTARSSSGSYCKVSSRVLDQVNVRCFDADGDRVDTRYYASAFEAL